MQLAPVLMALRDSVGLERVVVDTYQSVSGTGADAIAELEGQIRAHVRGRGQDRLACTPIRSRSTRSPRSTSSFPTDTPRRSGRSSARTGRSSACRTCASRAPPSGSRSSSAIPRLFTSRRATPSRPSARASCSVPCRASSSRTTPPRTSTRSRPRRPAGTRSSSAASGPTSRSPTAAVSPSGSSPTTSGRAPPRTPSSSPRCCVNEAGCARPQSRCARVRGRRSRRGHGVTDAERRSALEVIASEVRVCTKCRLHETRTRAVPGEGNPDTEVVFVGEGPGFNEDREGRPFVGRAGALLVEAPRLDRVAPRGRLHHERRQVPAAREPRPAARRDRGLRAVPASGSSGRWIRRWS